MAAAPMGAPGAAFLRAPRGIAEECEVQLRAGPAPTLIWGCRGVWLMAVFSEQGWMQRGPIGGRKSLWGETHCSTGLSFG